MQLAELMSTDPITIPSDMAPAEALARMDESNVRHLLVVDQGTLVGVLSDRALLGQPVGAVQHVMNAWPVTMRPDQTTDSLSKDTVRRADGCFPVVREGALLGVVTELDLLRNYVRDCGEHASQSGLDPAIERLMTRQVVSVESTDRLPDAEAVLATLSVRHAPVVRDGQLVGIISDRDLRRARGQKRGQTTTVDSITTRDVQTLSPSDSVSAAARIMMDHKISALPIVDDHLIGILSSRDVIEHWLSK